MTAREAKGAPREALARLLLVEDERVVAQNEAETLRRNGFVVTVAYSGEEALQAVQHGEPVDLLLLDINLGPGMDGPQTARAVLALRNVPIVFLTSHTEEEVTERIDQTTSYGYVVKDSGEGVLIASIRMAFRLHRAHVELEERSRQLRQSEARLEAVFNNLPFDVSVSNLEARYELQNSASRNHWGNAVGKLPEELGAPPDLVAEWRQYHRRATLGEVVSVERHYDFTDQERWVREIMAPVRSGGEIVAVLGVNFDVSEQKRAERSIREAEERLRATLQSIGDGVMSTDVGGTITEINKVAEELTGWSAAEAVGRPVEEVFHIVNSRTRKPASNPVEGALAEGATVGLGDDNLLIARDGEERQIEDSAALIRSPDGRVFGTILVFRDVSESYRMRRALEESTARLRSLFANMVEGVALHELVTDGERTPVNYRIIDVNPAYERILGMPREQTVGRLVTEGLRVSSPPYLTEYVGVALSGEPIRFESFFEPLHRHFEISVVPWGAAGFATVFTDVTDRKRAEHALEEREQTYRALFEGSNAVKLLADPDSATIVDANPAAVRFYGYSYDQLRRMSLFDLNPGPSQDVRGRMSGVIQQRQSHFEAQHRLASGEIRDVEIYGSLMVVSSRTLIFAIIHDITERKLAEAELSRTLDENHALYRELQHRIKNSLTLIRSLVSLERNRVAEPKTDEILGRIQDRIGSLADLYAMLDESARAGWIPLDEYLNRIVGSLASVYLQDRRRPVIERHFERVLVQTRTAASLGLILNELVTNALKHAFSAGREGTLELTLSEEDGEARLEISDDGIGPPADFDLANPSGLGLQLVMLLAGQLSGRVSFERGSRNRFQVRLPAEH